MYAHAIAQIEPPKVGIHLIWLGPHPWVYSPRGWSIQRRVYSGQDDRVTCEELNTAAIANLRNTREVRWGIGVLTLRDGVLPDSITAASGSAVPCDVFTFELAEPTQRTQVTLQGQEAFAFAMREGKVVDTGGPQSGTVSFNLRGIAIDTVIVYVKDPQFFQICASERIVDGEADWAGVPYIVQGLQIPLQELMPSLTDPAAEFAEAKARLLPEETLDEAEFDRLGHTLRPGLQQASDASNISPPRPIDQVLLMREDTAQDFEEMVALDPIRTLLSHPKWRRVLGFGWFDTDPNLNQGETYEYRITAEFPAEDVKDKVYGFHSMPSQTRLPDVFKLDGLRIRLPEPVTVQRSPDT